MIYRVDISSPEDRVDVSSPEYRVGETHYNE